MNAPKLNKAITRFLKDESGQTTTEYVLLLVLVVMAVKSVGSKLNSGLQSLIGTAFDKANSAIQNDNGN